MVVQGFSLDFTGDMPYDSSVSENTTGEVRPEAIEDVEKLRAEMLEPLKLRRELVRLRLSSITARIEDAT